MKLASTTGDFYGYTGSQAKSLELLREAGFHYADYNFGCDYSQRTGVFSADYEKHFEEISLAAREIGIKMIQAHSPMGDPIADDNAQFIKDTIRCIDACGAWGIPNLVVHSGYLRGISVEQTFAKNKEFYMPLLEAAEKYGVNILVENFNKMCIPNLYWIDNAPDLLAMVESINHPLFHAVWDTGHANMQDMPQDEALRLLGTHVRALHVQDNLGDKDSHLVPFLGTMNLDSVMNGLLDIGYDGYFTFEVGKFFLPADKRRPYTRDTRLANAPLDLRRAFERYLYELGKCVLEAYGCYEI
ncbi:MAG: sugar phosphate isomerase/epimerase [Ruminococcaceae bacterium]|nr:sugar phosphate isomerase/epimerase [Oscillospiraceae bacterium]